MITDQIGRQEVFLPINHENYNILGLVNLNYNFECDWLIELSDNNLPSELVENRSFLANHNQGNCNFYD